MEGIDLTGLMSEADFSPQDAFASARGFQNWKPPPPVFRTTTSGSSEHESSSRPTTAEQEADKSRNRTMVSQTSGVSVLTTATSLTSVPSSTDEEIPVELKRTASYDSRIGTPQRSGSGTPRSRKSPGSAGQMKLIGKKGVLFSFDAVESPSGSGGARNSPGGSEGSDEAEERRKVERIQERRKKMEKKSAFARLDRF